MTSDSRTKFVCLLVIATIVTSLVCRTDAARYHNSDDEESSPRHRHRHRHVGTSIASNRRDHDAGSASRRPQWPQPEDDYDDPVDVDEDEDEDNDDDGDYEMDSRGRPLYDRNHQQARNVQRNHRPRSEPRYSPRHHQTGHHANPWYRGTVDDDPDSRRNPRYGPNGGGRGHRQRPGRDWLHHEDRRRGDSTSAGNFHPSRNHEFEDPVENPEDEVELDHDVGYDRNAGRRWRFDEDSEDNVQDHRPGNGDPSRWWNSRKYRASDHHDPGTEWRTHRNRLESRRNDWKSRTSMSGTTSSGAGSGQKTNGEDWMDWRRKTSHRKRTGRPLATNESENDDVDDDRNDHRGSWNPKKSRNNFVDRGFNGADDGKKENDLDYLGDDDDPGYDGNTKKANRRMEDDDQEDDDEDFGKDDDDNDDADDDDQDFDNTNYYKNEDEPPYKTFDDIIKSLTSEDPATPKSSSRRDYRNTGIEKYLKRDAYGNMYDSRNSTVNPKPLRNSSNSARLSDWANNAGNKWRTHFSSNSESANHPNGKDAKKLSNAIGESAIWKAAKDHDAKIIRGKLEEQTKTKSLEQEYDEDYDNNEKDEDSLKMSDKLSTDMQADVTNVEYADEDNESETEGETSVPLATSTPMTMTTTPTTTTPRPVVATSTSRVIQDRRDSKSHETPRAPQALGLQSQQPGPGSHKSQSTNTRDVAKDPKPHGQPKNGNGKAEIKEAMQHAMKVSREGSCQWPRARVIPVREVYPSPSASYIPHCAILHRCSDDTGCCRSESLTCVPKVSHRVELYFYTNTVGGASGVEKLSFYNHTECECKERMGYGTSSDKTGPTNEHKHQPTAVSPPQNIRRPPQRKSCKCPSEFTPRITSDGTCQCHCYENDMDCIRTKRGKGYFSLRDRLCIQNDECAKPICEFGEYMRRQGKCPKKLDKFNAIANFPSNVHLHHKFRS